MQFRYKKKLYWFIKIPYLILIVFKSCVKSQISKNYELPKVCRIDIIQVENVILEA